MNPHESSLVDYVQSDLMVSIGPLAFYNPFSHSLVGHYEFHLIFGSKTLYLILSVARCSLLGLNYEDSSRFQ